MAARSSRGAENTTPDFPSSNTSKIESFQISFPRQSRLLETTLIGSGPLVERGSELSLETYEDLGGGCVVLF